MASEEEYPGEHCKQVGLTVACLMSEVGIQQLTNLTKGIIYELSLLRKTHDITWSTFYGWAKVVCGGSIAYLFGAFKVAVRQLERKVELSRHKKHVELQDHFLQSFCAQEHTQTSSEADEETEMSEAERALEKEKARTEELTAKLSKLSVCNVKRLKCRDLKITQAHSQVKELEGEVESQAKSISRLKNQLKTAQSSKESIRQKLYSVKKVDSTDRENKDLNAKLESFESRFFSEVEALHKKLETMCEEIDAAQRA